jgi:hypothetical protein
MHVFISIILQSISQIRLVINKPPPDRPYASNSCINRNLMKQGASKLQGVGNKNGLYKYRS